MKLISLFVLVIISHLSMAQLVRAPFEFIGKHLYIKATTAKSDTLNFIFDTGSVGGASLDSAMAEKIGIPKDNLQLVNVAGSGGAQNYWMAIHQNLKIANAELKDINMVLVNFKSLSEISGKQLDGIVGDDILNNYVTQLDFDNKELLLYDKITSVNISGYTGIPFQFNKGVMIPRFPISITLANGETFTGRVMFDTGNASTLLVSTPFSKFHDFDSKLGTNITIQGRGFSAITQDKVAAIKSMSFNGFDFGKMLIKLTVNDKAEPKDGYLGILGIDVIKRFNVIIDYANNKIYMKPNKAYNSPFTMGELDGKLAFKEKQETFLTQNKTLPGIHVTSSGLQYQIIAQGIGEIPKISDKVKIYFSTKLLYDQLIGKPFDSKNPWEHHLDKALEGMREALLMMPVGSKWRLYIPSSLGFGEDVYEDVPPGSTLIYELELVKITEHF